jgi:hypothetical protein
MQLIQQIKLIIEHEIDQEIKKQRFELQTPVGNAFTQFNIEIQKKLSRLSRGEDIFSLIPELKEKDLY